MDTLINYHAHVMIMIRYRIISEIFWGAEIMMMADARKRLECIENELNSQMLGLETPILDIPDA